MSVYDLDIRTDPVRLHRMIDDASTRPFWLDRPDRPAAAEPLPGPTDTGLLVVGGGYCGLWTALLAKREDPGRDVLLLEGRRIGWAASGRNGGFAEASLSHGEVNGGRRFAADLETIRRLGAENFAGFAADIRDLGLDVEWEQGGTLAVAVEPHQVEALRAAAGEGSAGSARFLEGEALADYTRSPVVRAALLETEGEALVHPGRLAAELARACREFGVRIHEHSPVRRIRDAGTAVHALTDTGTVRARSVVLATNGFPALLKRTRLLTVPIYDYAMVTEPLGAEQLAAIGWRGRHGWTDLGRQFHYARKSADDRILWGGFDAVYHRGGRVRPEHDQREETFLRLADHFVRTFPQLGDVRFSHRWGGMIDMSSRLVAFHGTALGGRVAYSAGFTGLGVVATRFAAAVMLDLLAGRRTERTESALVRGRSLPIPPEPIAYPAVQLVRAAVARSDRDGGRDGPLLRLAERLGYSFDS
ncbi:MAG: FAD-dependent oxidoreductase [Microbacteriaceae bacterium]